MSLPLIEYEDLILSVCSPASLSNEDFLSHKKNLDSQSFGQFNPESKLASAGLDCFEGNIDQAQAALLSLKSTQDPKLKYYTSLLLGFSFMKQGKIEKSTEHLLEANTLSSTSKNPCVLYSLVLEAYTKSGKYAQGVSFFHSIPEIKPDFLWEFQCKLGHMHEKQGSLEEAQKCFIIASHKNVKIGPVCELWACILAGQDVSEKFSNFFLAFEDQPQFIDDLNYIKALWFLRNSQYEKSANILRQLIVHNSKDSYLNALGYSMFKQNNMIQAFNYTLKALKLNDKNAEAWYNLSVIYNQVRQDESKAALKRAQKLGLGAGTPIEDLKDQILPTIELWTFGAQGVAKPARHKKSLKTSTVQSEVSKIVVPTAVKSTNYCKNPILNPSMFLNMYLMQNVGMRTFNKPQAYLSSKDASEYCELAHILSHLNIPAKRQRLSST